MKDICYISSPAQAYELLQPLRISILQQLSTPLSCPELARRLGETTQKIYYHIKVLEKSGLVRKVAERRVRGIMEGVYEAAAQSFWLSPRLVRGIGGGESGRDTMSFRFLLSLAERMQVDIGLLAGSGRTHIPTLGLSGRIRLESSADRNAFMNDLTRAFQELAEKYGARFSEGGLPGDDEFEFLAACYPSVTEYDRNKATD